MTIKSENIADFGVWLDAVLVELKISEDDLITVGRPGSNVAFSIFIGLVTETVKEAPQDILKAFRAKMVECIKEHGKTGALEFLGYCAYSLIAVQLEIDLPEKGSLKTSSTPADKVDQSIKAAGIDPLASHRRGTLH